MKNEKSEERRQMERDMLRCMGEHSQLVRPLLDKYDAPIIVETLLGAACVIAGNYIRPFVPELTQDEIEEAEAELLTKFHRVIDEFVSKYVPE